MPIFIRFSTENVTVVYYSLICIKLYAQRLFCATSEESHAGWQCADRRNINDAIHAQYTHNTEVKRSPGGEIDTLQTRLKILTGPVSGACCPSTGPVQMASLVGYSVPDFLPRQYCLYIVCVHVVCHDFVCVGYPL